MTIAVIWLVVGVKYIASVSFGKYSTAMVLKLIECHCPLDEVVFYDTGMEFNSIYRVRDKIKDILEENDIRYTELKPEKPFVYEMLAHPHKKKNGKYQYGYGWCGGGCRWGMLNKTRTINKYTNGHHVYVGIAADEPKRLANLDPWKSAPLAEWGMTEADCLRYCREHGVSWDENGVELYDVLDRVSCWCCSNKNRAELHAVWKFLPEYWSRLEALQERLREPMKRYCNAKYGNYGNVFDMEKVFEEESRYEQLNIFNYERG